MLEFDTRSASFRNIFFTVTLLGCVACAAFYGIRSKVMPASTKTSQRRVPAPTIPDTSRALAIPEETTPKSTSTVMSNDMGEILQQALEIAERSVPDAFALIGKQGGDRATTYRAEKQLARLLLDQNFAQLAAVLGELRDSHMRRLVLSAAVTSAAKSNPQLVWQTVQQQLQGSEQNGAMLAFVKALVAAGDWPTALSYHAQMPHSDARTDFCAELGPSFAKADINAFNNWINESLTSEEKKVAISYARRDMEQRGDESTLLNLLALNLDAHTRNDVLASVVKVKVKRNQIQEVESWIGALPAPDQASAFPKLERLSFTIIPMSSSFQTRRRRSSGRNTMREKK